MHARPVESKTYKRGKVCHLGRDPTYPWFRGIDLSLSCFGTFLPQHQRNALVVHSHRALHILYILYSTSLARLLCSPLRSRHHRPLGGRARCPSRPSSSRAPPSLMLAISAGYALCVAFRTVVPSFTCCPAPLRCSCFSSPDIVALYRPRRCLLAYLLVSSSPHISRSLCVAVLPPYALLSCLPTHCCYGTLQSPPVRHPHLYC